MRIHQYDRRTGKMHLISVKRVARPHCVCLRRFSSTWTSGPTQARTSPAHAPIHEHAQKSEQNTYAHKSMGMSSLSTLNSSCVTYVGNRNRSFRAGGYASIITGGDHLGPKRKRTKAHAQAHTNNLTEGQACVTEGLALVRCFFHRIILKRNRAHYHVPIDEHQMSRRNAENKAFV